MAREVHAEAQETNGTAAEAQGCVPPLSFPTRGAGDLEDDVVNNLFGVEGFFDAGDLKPTRK
jgi:hypothetical protein